MKNHPNRKPNRLKYYDYSQDGYYFVTLCTKNRKNYFGEIVNAKMILNEYGEVAKKCWLEIPSHFPQVILDEFIIMPDHMHGVLIIVGNADRYNNKDNPIVGNADLRSQLSKTNLRSQLGKIDLRSRLRKINLRSQQSKTITLFQQYRTKMYLSKAIHGFKSSVTRKIRKQINNHKFAWQSSFYDHIVRNEESLIKIRHYIKNNPLKWGK